MKRLVIGCGYVGRRVATGWVAAGDDVWALTRSSAHAASLAAEGLRPVIGDVLEPEGIGSLPSVDTVLYAVGFDRTAGASKRQVYVDGLRGMLRLMSRKAGRLLYVSSTSVYGQSNGEWVDESSPVNPISEGGGICLDAEQVARDTWPEAARLSVLRLSGIYGPGRLAARLDVLKQQRPIETSADGWLNLIHVDDACDAIARCAALDDGPPTLLVSDDGPLIRRDYYTLLAEAIAAPSPVFAEQADDGDCGKRCANRLARKVLGWRPRYPTFREGMATAIPSGR